MEFSQTTRIVFDRIRNLEPANFSKIVGYLLLQDYGEHELIHLALGPDNLVQSLVNKAKTELGLPTKLPSTEVPPSSIISAPISDLSLQFSPITRAPSCQSSPASFRAFNSYCEPLNHRHPSHDVDFVSTVHMNSIRDGGQLHNQAQYLSLNNTLEIGNPVGPEYSSNHYCYEPTSNNLAARNNHRLSNLLEFPGTSCFFFNRGFCKHGTNCKFFHDLSFSDDITEIWTPNPSDDHLGLPSSLEELDLELKELLRERRGVPVSVASLPMLYYERYGKTLQAEGYLTETQRQGKTCYSLTKLLAQFNDSIRLIDRPHGQHSVVFAEDTPRYMGNKSWRSDPGPIVPGSRQIYLTFPPESSFIEEDVSNYFKNFGPVQDVRIPCQQKRMFGFVTFLYPETVKLILTKGNPHFVCGSRVLVKPYREKSRLVDRKYTQKIEASGYPLYFPDTSTELHSTPRMCNDSKLRLDLVEEHEQVPELEQRRLSAFQLASKSLIQSNHVNLIEDLKNGKGTGSVVDEKAMHASCNFSDLGSNQVLDLPENPFTSPLAS